MVAIVVEGGDGRFERHHGEIEGGGRKLAMGDKRGRLLNSIFGKWRISASSNWNISGELCSGAAVDSTNMDNNGAFNPGIKCDCSSNTCHITQLKVYALDVVGAIPDELWNLTYLINLNLAQNYLTGPLSASIGNLVSMQYLSLGINSLSGELPKELGKLTDLRSLSFSSNNFSGPLPSELGSLTKLTQIITSKMRCNISHIGLVLFVSYFDSSGLSGPIPSTYASLQELTTVWASDNALTGRIPGFIGNWSKLNVLRLQGNSFEGPIPTTLSNLTSLTELRISDLSNGSSTLDFIKEMKSLTVLVLRNNNMSGSIPSDIGGHQNLTQLFLGNNKLSGTLPPQKSPSLRNIDLSYNELSGTFPTWISEPNIQINLAVNNFTIEGSDSSVLPAGLNCLQRGFPCNRGLPRYYNFSVKCGGPQVTSSDRIVYERDNQTLGPATYYVNPANRWAVSNAGLHAGSNNPQYIYASSSQFTNTLDSELFQTARISAGSLRYYGLGLENGNYTVKLQFAEIAFLNPPTWKSLGKRIFDIYIQGNLMWKDFDIRKEAGSSFRALPKEFKVRVSENYLEIHLFWAGKGTCCIPDQGTYGPSISAISATPDFIPTVSNDSPVNSSSKSDTGLIVGIVVPVAVLSFLAVGFVFFFIQRRKRRKASEDEELIDKGYVSRGIMQNMFHGALTSGYLAPEYAMRGHLTEKADVFGFGVVALEIVSGRSNSDSSLEDDKVYLLEWAWQLHEDNRGLELVDPSLSTCNESEAKRVIDVALLCTQTSPNLRPPMSRVVAMLSGDIEVTPVTTKPGYLTDWKFSDSTTFLSADASTSNTDQSTQFSSSAGTTQLSDPNYTPVNVSASMLGEGR
uniref:non-specific serine/threonine protein kinase n=1 Tax=Daucus carota subsp. sativus TaxID=79200 RepID=A0A161ZX01_DAUCS